MNDERRKLLREAMSRLSDVQNLVEDVKTQEEEILENMPEALKSGEKGDKQEEIIQYLSAAYDNIETAVGEIDNAQAA